MKNHDRTASEDKDTLLQELRIHQIELEMQNEELRRTQEQLEISRSRYFDLYELAPVGFMTLNDKGMIREANLTTAKLLGTEKDKLIALPFSTFIHAMDQDVYYLRRKQCRASDVPVSWEMQMARVDGSSFWASLQAVHSKNEELWITLTDISERKRSEAALQLAKNEWELTFDNVPDLIAILDDQHRIKRVNRAMAERLKLEPADCIGKKCFKAVHGTDEPPCICPHSRTIADTCAHEVELYEPRLDGDFLVTTNPLFDSRGGFCGSVHVARDITVQKQTEKLLRENEERMQLFIEHAPVALAMFDRDMRYLSVSRRWLDNFGLGERPLTGVSHYEVFPEIPAQWKEMHRRGLAGEVLRAEEDRFERADGSVQWVRWEIRPWYDAAGNVGGIVIFSEEITARKQTEEVLHFMSMCGVTESGEGFFHELARYLARTLTMDFICIDRLEEDRLSATTLAVFHNGEFEDNVSYALKDTPCGDVVGRSICCFPRNVCALFPDDAVLQDLQAESYLGTTLWSSDGKPIGLIAVISRQPLSDTRSAEAILQMVAVRAAWELERLNAEEALHEIHTQLEQRVAERTEELSGFIKQLKIEVHERKQAEKNLERVNRLYEVLSETNQAIVRVSNRDRDRDTLFRNFCRIAVERGGFLLSWVGVIDEESGEIRRLAACGATSYLDEVQISLNEEPAGEGPTGIAIRTGTYHISNDFQHDPGTALWHEKGRAYGIKASAAIALKEQGRVVGVLSLYADEVDFFDWKQIELLIQMGSDISFALDNLTREFLRMKAEQALQDETTERLRAVEALRTQERLLIQQNRHAAMGEMIGNIAHQWRQPLNTLGLFTQRLGVFYGSPSFNKEFLDTSVAKSMEIIQYMSRTIDDFRNFFSTDREKSSFRVDEAVSMALSLVEASFKDRKIRIEKEGADDVIIHGFKNEYSQVLLNIFINARDVMRERNIENPCLRLTIGSENGVSLVTVADNAGGISEDIIDRIFDPYFTTKGPQQGTGVGLFMSKAIIENNLGGRLTVCNNHEGAEFRIEV